MLIPNKESLKKTKIVQSLKKFANHNIVAKVIVGLFVWIIALIPTWLYVGVRWLIDPTGFWQELAIFGIFAIIIGLVQFLLFLGGVILTIVLIFEDL